MPWLGTKTFNSGSFYNPAELNRQNENTEYLANEINTKIISISLPQPIKKDNIRTDFPTVSKINQLKENIKYLIDNAPINENPAIVVSLERLQAFDFTEANKLERNLLAIYDIINKIEDYFKYCGTFYCGGVNNGLY